MNDSTVPGDLPGAELGVVRATRRAGARVAVAVAAVLALMAAVVGQGHELGRVLIAGAVIWTAVAVDARLRPGRPVTSVVALGSLASAVVWLVLAEPDRQGVAPLGGDDLWSWVVVGGAGSVAAAGLVATIRWARPTDALVTVAVIALGISVVPLDPLTSVDRVAAGVAVVTLGLAVVLGARRRTGDGPGVRLTDPGDVVVRMVGVAIGPAALVVAEVVTVRPLSRDSVVVVAVCTVLATIALLLGAVVARSRPVSAAASTLPPAEPVAAPTPLALRSADLGPLVEHIHDIVVVTGPDGEVRHANREWSGRTVFESGATERDRTILADRFAAALAMGHRAVVEAEVRIVHEGRARPADAVIANRLDDPVLGAMVVTFRGVTDEHDIERQLSHRAFHDELTGLANRALFLDRMDHALRVTRHGGDPVMVLFIDLDDFKEVNDRHGHAVGDEALRAIAQRIRAATSSGDTAARLGGDEFAVLLEDTGGIERALELAERLLSGLREPLRIGSVEVVVLASIGIAVAPAGASTTSLLREADLAMYEAKRAGKGQIRIFDPAMRRVAARHAAYRNELGQAIERNQLRVVFQPYVDLASGEVRGAEALARWHHPEHGEIPPGEFVPIAVRSGLIVPIGRWVIREALDQVVEWRADVDLFVSVNLTAGELRHPDLIDHLIDVVRERRLPPSTLLLEVTETDLMDDSGRAIDTVAELRAHGFRVALDDFGAGYCSISHLQQHPVDMIKIDKVFVAELDRPGGDATMVRAVLGLTETLGIRSAAEGIETPEQLHELRRLGCRMGQGHLLAGPLEAPVIARRFGRANGVVPTVHH